jgi:hypothetical protein
METIRYVISLILNELLNSIFMVYTICRIREPKGGDRVRYNMHNDVSVYRRGDLRIRVSVCCRESMIVSSGKKEFSAESKIGGQ